MDRVVLTQQELAERWGVTVKALTDWRNAGVLQPIKGIPAIRFSMEYIKEIEGVEIEKFSPLEKKRLEKEIEDLRFKNQRLTTVLSNILSESAKVINF